MTGRWPVGTVARIVTRAGDEATAIRSLDGSWYFAFAFHGEGAR